MGGLFRFCRLRWKFSGESVGALETRQFDSSLHRRIRRLWPAEPGLIMHGAWATRVACAKCRFT